jgi:effector-binding domain-containing protein
MELSEPEVIVVDTQSVVEIRRVLAMADVPGFFHEALAQLSVYLDLHDVEFAGPPLGITRGIPQQTIDIAAAIPVAAGVQVGGQDDIDSTTLPAGRVATLTFTGPYDQLGKAYITLRDWIDERGEKPAGLAWEKYHTMPEADGDPSQTVTQLCWLLN